MNLFNGQPIRATQKDNSLFEGFYSKTNNLNEEVIVNLQGGWCRLSEVSNIEIVGRNLREDAQATIDKFVDQLDGKELAKGLSDADKNVLEKTAEKLVGDDAKGNEEEVHQMVNDAILSKQIANSQDSMSNTISRLSKQQESFDFNEEVDNLTDINNDEDSVHTSMYGDPSEAEIYQALSDFYKLNSCKEDLIEYYKFLTLSNDDASAQAAIEQFLDQENGIAVDASYDIDSEVEDYINEIDSDDLTVDDLFTECCKHFNLTENQIQSIREQGTIDVASFETLQECILENRRNSNLCTPKRFAEAFVRNLKEEQYKDSFVPETVLNNTLSDFVTPTQDITLANNSGAVINSNEDYRGFSDQLKKELAPKLSLSPEDFAIIVQYLSKYVNGVDINNDDSADYDLEDDYNSELDTSDELSQPEYSEEDPYSPSEFDIDSSYEEDSTEPYNAINDLTYTETSTDEPEEDDQY